MVRVTAPAASPPSESRALAQNPNSLPTEDIVQSCASRYFEKVHSMYWLYSTEEFYTRLEATYSRSRTQQSGSWLCSLHSIVALGASSIQLPESPHNEELGRKSLEAAKLLVSTVCDQSDLDGVRAYILLVSTHISGVSYEISQCQLTAISLLLFNSMDTYIRHICTLASLLESHFPSACT